MKAVNNGVYLKIYLCPISVGAAVLGDIAMELETQVLYNLLS